MYWWRPRTVETGPGQGQSALARAFVANCAGTRPAALLTCPLTAEWEASLAGMIFFTDNYQDRSTNDGYQFETCGQESGGGKFCQSCGHPLAAAESARKFCGNCGTALTGAKFCVECGTPAG